MAPPRRSERLARELANNAQAAIAASHLSRHVLRRLSEIADDKLTSGDLDCLRVARLCCRIGGQLRTGEARACSFARLASALRLANRLDHAERALNIAWAAAPPRLKGDVLRRRSYLRIYQGRLAEGVQDAEAAVSVSVGITRIRALGALGIALGYSDKPREAIAVHAQCLAETDPDDSYYCNAIHNYATSLSKGTDREAVRALKLCMELRPRLKFRHKMQRAKLWWTEGLLHHRLGHRRRAWRCLDHARRSLVALGAAAELAALVADMARVSPQQPAIRFLCDDVADVVAAQRSLVQPLRSLAAAAREMIPEAAAALRQAASGFAPCPAL